LRSSAKQFVRNFFGIACNPWLKSQEIERFGAAKGAGKKAF
jgi:hypothetical protein